MGCLRLTAVLYTLAIFLLLATDAGSPFFETLHFAKGLAGVAPVVAGVGIITAVIGDLALRERGDK